MYGQMTAGSWIYIGSQGIVQGTYETFGAVAREHFGGIARGSLRADGGTRRHGRRAAARRDDVRRRAARHRGRRIAHRQAARDALLRPQDALARRGARAGFARRRPRGRALSVGLVGNAADVLPELVRRGVTPDVVTDQTSAHDTLNGYVPDGHVARRGRDAASRRDPEEYVRRSDGVDRRARARDARRCSARGAITFDYGNNIRTVALDAGVPNAFDVSRVRAGVRAAAVLRRARARSAGSRCRGDPEDIHRTDDLVLELFPDDEHLRRWITLARERIAVSGTAGAHLLARAGPARAVRRRAQRPRGAAASCRAPIVIGRDHLDTGSVASPFRETEGMKDGSDAIADWAILNALLNVASGASWVSFHHGGGVGIGNSLHAGQVIVADGTPEMRVRLERVLTNDPGIGVARHADAGYDIR